MKLVKLTITSLARMIDHEHIKIVQTHISIIYISLKVILSIYVTLLI